MEAQSNFADIVLRKVKPGEKFEPQAYYDPDGDCIEFLAMPEDYYAERIDDLVTVYCERESGKVIGAQIKGFKGFIIKILERFPGFRLEIEDGRVTLTAIFKASLWSSEMTDSSDMRVVTYKRLLEIAEQSRLHVNTELCSL